MGFSFNWFSSIGLLLDIIGVVLLFKYGLPSKLKIPASVMEFSDDLKLQYKKDNDKIYFRSHLGLILIIIGFVFQLIRTNLTSLPTNS